VVLLHGFGTSAFLWRNVAPQLAKAGKTVFAIDMLGYGESDRPLDAQWGVAAQAEYVAAALTSLRVTRAMVVGNDIGGNVALSIAARFPERVERLVLINTIVGAEVHTPEIRAMQRSTARFALRLNHGVMGATPLLQPLLERSVANPAHMPPRLVARYLATYTGREGVRHLLHLARALREDDLPDVDIGRVRTPTLLVWGDADLALDANAIERTLTGFPKARLKRVQGAGRLVPEEAAEELALALIEFVRSPEAVAPY
jgi:pimeloyl-ACP methyl ester carboxylesterase